MTWKLIRERSLVVILYGLIAIALVSVTSLVFILAVGILAGPGQGAPSLWLRAPLAALFGSLSLWALIGGGLSLWFSALDHWDWAKR